MLGEGGLVANNKELAVLRLMLNQDEEQHIKTWSDSSRMLRNKA